MKLKFAKISDAKKVAKIFSQIGEKPAHRVIDLIKEKRVMVLKDKKKIKAAFSFTLFSITGFFTYMYIQKLGVAPELNGQGVGTLLLTRIKLLNVKLGITALFLFSVSSAQNFYKKNKLKFIARFFWWRHDHGL